MPIRPKAQDRRTPSPRLDLDQHPDRRQRRLRMMPGRYHRRPIIGSDLKPPLPPIPRRGACLPHQALSQELLEDATMPRVKQASKQKRTTKPAALTALGAGLGLSLVGSASASTMPTAYIPQSDNTSPSQRFVLSEEELADVSLATFHLFDREDVGSGTQGTQLAVVVVRRCGGCRACRGCAWRGCGCGGCAACGGCCARWGQCRWC